MIVDSLRYTDGKVLEFYEGIKPGIILFRVFGTILINIDRIIIGIDVGKEIGSFKRYFDGSNDGMLEGFFLGGSLGSNNGKVIVSDEYTKLILSDGKMLGTIPGNVYGIALEFDVVSELGSLDGSFGGSNDGKVGVLLLGGSLRSTDG